MRKLRTAAQANVGHTAFFRSENFFFKAGLGEGRRAEKLSASVFSNAR